MTEKTEQGKPMNLFSSFISRLPDGVVEAAKAVPPLSVAAASWETRLHTWVYVATLIYIALQVGWLIWRWRRAAKDKNWTPGE